MAVQQANVPKKVRKKTVNSLQATQRTSQHPVLHLLSCVFRLLSPVCTDRKYYVTTLIFPGVCVQAAVSHR